MPEICHTVKQLQVNLLFWFHTECEMLCVVQSNSSHQLNMCYEQNLFGRLKTRLPCPMFFSPLTKGATYVMVASSELVEGASQGMEISVVENIAN